METLMGAVAILVMAAPVIALAGLIGLLAVSIIEFLLGVDK